MNTAPPDRPNGSMVRYAAMVRGALASSGGGIETEELNLAPPQAWLDRFPAPLQTALRYAVIAANARRLLPRQRDVLLHLLDGSHAYLLGAAGKLAVPLVATVHDMIPALRLRGELGAVPPGGAGAWIVRRTLAGLARADALSTDSSCTRNDVIRVAGIRPELVHVVHPSVRMAGGGGVSPGSSSPPYVLHVAGNNTFYKNRAGVIDVFKELRQHEPVRLIMAGAPPDRELQEKVAASGVRDAIEFMVDVSEEQLAELYRHAAFLLFPSLYEGFGWPPLEAMACGCPVLCSDAGSLPEITGEAALIAPSGDLAAFVEQGLRLLRDPELRRKQIAAGLQQVRPFTHESLGAGLLKTYQAAEDHFRDRIPSREKEDAGLAGGLKMEPGLLRMPSGLGENASGTPLPIEPFIRGLAERLDKAGLEWAVLRNAEGLPDFTRYDLDVLVRRRGRRAVLQHVEEAAVETGWRIAGRIRKVHYTCLMLIKGTVGDGLFFLPLDLFTALEYRGLRYLDAESVLQERIQTPRGIWTIPPGTAAAITLLKEWFPHGVLKANSRAAVQVQAAADPDRFCAALAAAVGPEQSSNLVHAVQRGDWRLSVPEARALRRAARLRNPGWLPGLFHAWAANLVHLFRPSLGFVVCLAGPDGSGKTTLAQGLAERTFKQPFKACRYIHGNIGVLPRFRDIRAFFLRRPVAVLPEPQPLKGMMEPLPAWKSMVLAVYYALDLLLARPLVRRWRGQWTLVILDRSFYDYYYQLGHRGCPHGFLNALAVLIPKPDLLLCIAGDAEKIHTRKPELTPEEIRNEQELLRHLAARLPFGQTVDGTVGSPAMVAAGRHEILDRLLRKTDPSRPPGQAPLCVWRRGGRPLLAYPAGSRAERLCALDLFPQGSPRRRMLAAGIRFCIRTGLDSRAVCDSAVPGELLTPEEWAGLPEIVRASSRADPADWLLAWPARPERHRMYLIFRDAATRRIGVVKIAAGDFNVRQLRNEADMLWRLAGTEHPFALPELLFQRELEGGRALLGLGGFPEQFRPMSTAQAVMWSRVVIEHLKSLTPEPTAEETEPPLRFVHGDLGPGNMLLTSGGGLFLFDWENASPAAPARVDEVGFWLSLRQGRVLRAPYRQADALRREFRGCPESELLAALDYLRARDNLAAAGVREAWS